MTKKLFLKMAAGRDWTALSEKKLESGKDAGAFTEIEKKFLISGFPDTAVFGLPESESEILQACLSIKPEIRIRLISDDGGAPYCRLETKSSGTLVRKEAGIDITEDEFYRLLKLAAPAEPIKKIFKAWKRPDDLIEKLNIQAENPPANFLRTGYFDNNGRLCAEIEFPDEASAAKFRPEMDPMLKSVFIKDVTDDPAHKLKNIWAETNRTK